MTGGHGLIVRPLHQPRQDLAGYHALGLLRDGGSAGGEERAVRNGRRLYEILTGRRKEGERRCGKG